jgi:hypothetical protein
MEINKLSWFSKPKSFLSALRYALCSMRFKTLLN